MSDRSSPPDPNTETTRAGFHAEDRRGLISRPWQLAGAGILSALFIWSLVMPRYPFIVYLHQGTMGGPDPGEAEASARYQYANPTLLFATIAGSCAMAFVIVEGLARRSIKFIVLGLFSGAFVSGGIGAAAGWMAQWVVDQPLFHLIDLAKGVLVQVTAWSVAGLGIGLGFALPTWRARVIGSSAMGALLGGLLAAFLYGPSVALIFQMANTDTIVPKETIERLTWLGTATILIGCAIGGLARPRQKNSLPL